MPTIQEIYKNQLPVFMFSIIDQCLLSETLTGLFTMLTALPLIWVADNLVCIG